MKIHHGKYAFMGCNGGILSPKKEYKHARIPDFKAYSEGNMFSADYEMELWVLIVKVN